MQSKQGKGILGTLSYYIELSNFFDAILRDFFGNQSVSIIRIIGMFVDLCAELSCSTARLQAFLRPGSFGGMQLSTHFERKWLVCSCLKGAEMLQIIALFFLGADVGPKLPAWLQRVTIYMLDKNCLKPCFNMGIRLTLNTKCPASCYFSVTTQNGWNSGKLPNGGGGSIPT